MQVVAGDTNQYFRSCGIDRHRLWHHTRQRLGPLCIDQDADQLVPGAQRPANDNVTLRDEHARHIAIGELTFLSEDVVSKPLEELQPRIVGIIDGNPVIEHSVACRHVP